MTLAGWREKVREVANRKEVTINHRFLRVCRHFSWREKEWDGVNAPYVNACKWFALLYTFTFWWSRGLATYPVLAWSSIGIDILMR